MISWLLKFINPFAGYWQAIVTFGLTSIVALGIHTLDVNHLKAMQMRALSDQAAAITQAFKEAQQKNSEIANDLHQKNNNTSDSYDNAIGLLNEQNCKSNPPTIPGRNDGSTSSFRLYYSNPEAARALLKRQKAAQIQTNQLLACQKYVLDNCPAN